MATPAFECLRNNLPQARIVGVLKRSAHGIVRDAPWFDDLVEGDDRTWAGFGRMRSQLKSVAPEAALLLTNSLRSALTMRLSGVPRIYGYRREGRDLLLAGGPRGMRPGKAVPSPTMDHYLELCRWLGLAVSAQPKPKLFIGAELRRRGDALLGKYGIGTNDFLVGLNPGASFGSAKCWPAEYFAEVAELCQERFGAKVILFCGPGEEGIAQAIRGQTKARLVDTRGDPPDLELLKPLVQRCNLVIANDTGPRHYAVAFDVPVVVLMGPTDPRYTNRCLDRTVVLRKELDCSPCQKRVCPRQHECMREIRPAEVLLAAEELLDACT
jgi:heptosyltransferase-2